MIRRPPRSTLFPTRRSSDLSSFQIWWAQFPQCVVVPTHKKVNSQTCHRLIRTSHEYERCERSEEHTSELQSQSNLVCRLLLEKKNSPASRGPLWRKSRPLRR